MQLYYNTFYNSVRIEIEKYNKKDESKLIFSYLFNEKYPRGETKEEKNTDPKVLSPTDLAHFRSYTCIRSILNSGNIIDRNWGSSRIDRAMAIDSLFCVCEQKLSEILASKITIPKISRPDYKEMANHKDYRENSSAIHSLIKDISDALLLKQESLMMETLNVNTLYGDDDDKSEKLIFRNQIMLNDIDNFIQSHLLR